MNLQGKVALITGAAQGMGKAFSQRLLKCGASVAMVDIEAKQGEATKQELESTFGKNRVSFFKGNVTDQKGFEGVFKAAKEAFGGLDIVINNAGVGGELPGQWERTIDINVNGMIRGTLLAFDSLRKDMGGRGGVVVNIASMAGISPLAACPTYCASKSAIIHYSKSWAQHPDLSANGVRINVFAPAFVDTKLTSGLIAGEYVPANDLVKTVIDNAGIMSPEAAADALLELIDFEEAKHGQVMTLSLHGGKHYV